MPSLILGVGYLGAALAARLCAGGHRVVGLENGFATPWDSLAALTEQLGDRFQLQRGDVRDPEALERAFAVATPVDAVYLLAAQASAHADAAPPEYTEETNLRAPRLVLDAALRHGAPPVIYGSSFRVYGAPLSGLVDERTPYGAFRDLSHLSKVYAEKLGELYADVHGVGFAPVRLGIVYGVGPVMKRDPHFVTVPHAFAIRAVRREPLTVNLGGADPLGFIHLDDATSALIASRSAGYAPAVAVSELHSVLDVASAIVGAATERGWECAVQAPSPMVPTPGPQVSSRLVEAGWRPTRSLVETAGELLDFYAA
ncbi:MAG TPA: NAD(P)-dependent oxidoreductase [Chloroflexota bacterium]|nr:NAD(P)-dependent oxidoreductase [Chloroflexota bacterium]